MLRNAVTGWIGLFALVVGGCASDPDPQMESAWVIEIEGSPGFYDGPGELGFLRSDGQVGILGKDCRGELPLGATDAIGNGLPVLQAELLLMPSDSRCIDHWIRRIRVDSDSGSAEVVFELRQGCPSRPGFDDYVDYIASMYQLATKWCR